MFSIKDDTHQARAIPGGSLPAILDSIRESWESPRGRSQIAGDPIAQDIRISSVHGVEISGRRARRRRRA